MFNLIIFLDLKNGPIKEIIVLEIFDENLKPKILNSKKKKCNYKKLNKVFY